MKTFVRAWGVFSIVFAIAILGLSFAFKFDHCKPGGDGKYPGGFKMPVIALELPASADALSVLLASPDCRRQQARGLVLDNFLNIPLYAIWIAGLCFILIQSRASGIRLAGILSLVTLLVAVVADYTENHFMGVAIGHQGNFTNQMADHIRYPSMLKWLAIFLTLSLISTLFIKIGLAGSVVGWLIAACFLLSFLIDLSALAFKLSLIESVWYPQFPAIALISYLFLHEPQTVTAAL